MRHLNQPLRYLSLSQETDKKHVHFSLRPQRGGLSLEARSREGSQSRPMTDSKEHNSSQRRFLPEDSQGSTTWEWQKSSVRRVSGPQNLPELQRTRLGLTGKVLEQTVLMLRSFNTVPNAVVIPLPHPLTTIKLFSLLLCNCDFCYCYKS